MSYREMASLSDPNTSTRHQQPLPAISSLMQLPLECAGGVIDVAVSQLGLKKSLYLRLVNSFFDQEVIMSISRQKLLNEDELRLPYMRNHYCSPNCHRKNFTHMCPFLAKYTLYSNNQREGKWNHDMPNFVCRITDRLQPRAKFKFGERLRIATVLWRQVLEFVDWMDQRLLFPESPTITETSLEDHLSVARLLFGNESIFNNIQASSNLLGSSLYAAIKTRQHVLVRRILEANTNVNEPMHRALETACHNRDKEMVQLLLSPQFNLDCNDLRFGAATNLAIRLDSSEIAVLLLAHAGGQSLSKILHDGLRLACFNNNRMLVREILAIQPDQDLDPRCYCARRIGTQLPSLCESPLEVAAWSGHVELLQELLLAHGDPTLDLRRRMILQAVLGGHVPVILMTWTPEADLPINEWIEIIKKQLMRDEFSVSFWGSLKDHGVFDFGLASCGEEEQKKGVALIMREACRRGAVEVVRMLALQKVPIEGPFYDKLISRNEMIFIYGKEAPAESMTPNKKWLLKGRVPLLEAIYFSQTAVVNLLLELGATPVDPMQSCMSRLFKLGKVPNKPPSLGPRSLRYPGWQRIYLGDCNCKGCR